MCKRYFFILIALLSLAGCNLTRYSIERCVGEGEAQICVRAEAATRRAFESFEFSGNLETGELSLKGSKVSTQYSPLEHAAADVLRKLDPTGGLSIPPEQP